MKALFRVLIKIFGYNMSRKYFIFFSSYVLRNKKIRHFLPSIIYSKEDVNTNSELINLVADSAKLASKNILNCGKKGLHDSEYLNIFPGEHYRLLNAFVKVTGSKKVVEIGTYTGMGSLALKDGINGVTVTTFDIIPWDKLNEPSHFNARDFDSTISQIIGDLSKDDVFIKYKNILNEADIIFMDAPKDDNFEYAMAYKLSQLEKKEKKFLILDDIQLVNMIDFWRAIASPKIDATSFGHFSGTGIVDISDGFQFFD